MNRSDFLSTMAAVFCGVLLPKPARETIRIATGDEIYRISAKIPLSQDVYDRVMPESGAFEALSNKIFDFQARIVSRQSFGKIVGVSE